MVVVALVCVSWTVWLIILTVAPNQTANYLMNTGGYDDGQFWLIPEKLTTLQIFSVIGLVVVAILYMYVLLKMLVWRVHRHAEGTLLDRILQHCAPDQTEGSAQLELSHRVRHLIWQLYTHFKELTGFRGKYRKLWVCLSLQTRGFGCC
jgi:beta-lactamase regulating signal transducer with metallopeptidase domain